MSIEFVHPWYLILIPIVIGLLIFSMRYMFTNQKSSKIKQVVLRAVLATALILALAQVSVKWNSRDITTIFLVDASDSVRERKEEVIKFINEAVKEKGKNDLIGVVAFGGNNRVEQFVSKEFSFSELQTDIEAEATDLEAAINMAYTLMSEDSAKRIVLLTDGNENKGDIANTVSNLVANRCSIEIYKLEENVANEVYVSDISLPENVAIGENFVINVEVESNVSTPATVSLYSGRTLKSQQSVMLQTGENHLIFKDTQTDEGLKTYRVVVEADEDTLTVNNEFSAFTSIEIDLPLLIVNGEEGAASELYPILDSIGISYQSTTPSTVPTNISGFSEYSAIVLVNVYADDLQDGFVDNIKTYVRDYGGGLIAIGGEDSFALGNYRDTDLEEVLPVYMDLKGENEVPTMAMQMVIDRSGSMSDGNGIITNLDLAKEAAVSAIRSVRDTDYVGVIAFDDSYQRVVELQIANNKDAVSDLTYTIGLGGGTSIYPALLAATQDINDCDAMVKHIVLLTDGQDTYGEYDELKEQINAAGITLSTVAVGTGCNDILLRDLAESCGGRYYYTDTNSDLPRIFAQEVFLSSNTYLVNEEFVPVITSTDTMLESVGADGMPSLYGYVATTKKERAIQVLGTPYGDPLLTYWQYGLGKGVAWTSDMSGLWSAPWAGWEGSQQLWYNIIKKVTQDNGIEGSYTEVEQNGNQATVKYFTEQYSANTDVEATVFDDDGNVTSIKLEPIKPGAYEAKVATPGTGVYSISVQQSENGEIQGSINTAAIMQYSMEYRLNPNNTTLEDFANAVGATFITKPEEVFATQLSFVKGRLELANILLLISSFLFLLDIALRRFKVDWYKILPIEKIQQKRAQKREKRELKRAQKVAQKQAKTGGVAQVEAMMEEKVYDNPKSDIDTSWVEKGIRGMNTATKPPQSGMPQGARPLQGRPPQSGMPQGARPPQGRPPQGGEMPQGVKPQPRTQPTRVWTRGSRAQNSTGNAGVNRLDTTTLLHNIGEEDEEK